MKIIVGMLITLLSISTVMSQEVPPNKCGTKELNPDHLATLKEFQEKLQPWMLAEPEITYYLPIQFHIVGDDKGNGRADLSLVLESICTVNELYAGSGIQFYLEDKIHYIDNTAFYSHDYQDGHLMMRQNNVNNMINVYVVLNAADACGYYSRSDDAVAIAQGCMVGTSTTLAHELGHFLGLPHTFLGWESGEPPAWKKERADGSNCSTAGDGFCDTPADYLPERWSCPYTGSPLIDPVGDTVVPDETQIMSYSSDYCHTKFSKEQEAAMRHHINNYRQGMAASFVPYGGIISMPNMLSPKLEENPVPANYSVFKWNDVPKANGYQIQISRIKSMGLKAVDVYVTDTVFVTTELQAGLTYYWRVRPIARRNTCTDFTSPEEFSVGQPSGITDVSEGNVIIYPNPVRAGESVQVEITNEKQANSQIQLLDLNGRTLGNFATQGRKTSIPVGNLSKGVYLVRIISDDLNVVRKISIQ